MRCRSLGKKKAVKDRETLLDSNVLAKYPTLTEAEVKTLVVEDKWLGTIATDIHGEMDRISQALTQRGTELAERYEIPLPLAVSKVGAFEQKVPSPREDGVRMVAVTGNSCPRSLAEKCTD